MIQSSLILKRTPSYKAEGSIYSQYKNASDNHLLAVLPIPVYTCDLSGVVVFYNEAAAKLWDRRPEIGKDLWCGSWKMFTTDGLPIALENCPMARTIREKKPVRDNEIIIERADGTRRHIISYPEPIFDVEGNLTGAINMLVDVTESQKALRENEEQFRSLANSMPQMVWIAGKDGFVNWYNQRWYDYTGTNSEMMKKMGHGKLCHPDHVKRVTEHFNDCFENGHIWEDTFPLRGKDGSYRWFLSRAYPVFDAEGNIVRWFGTNTDINEILKAEEVLKQADTRKDEFLNTISHELRTPMNAIIGISHILSKSAPLNDNQLTCIETLQDSSESLLSLINNLLDSKVGDENIKLENIPFNLRELMEEVVAVMRKAALEKKITLEMDYDKKLEDKYIGDPQRFRQVILNLVSNAIKFTERGGVNIIVGMTSASDKLANIAVHIVDTGIGIPLDKQKTIFDKFSQGDSSISRKYGGTGLGLAISETLATLMGGEITVESRYGVGSEFTFRLSLALDNSAAPDNIMPAVTKTSKTRKARSANKPLILVAEDYKPNLLVTISYMDMLGYNYETAQSGEEMLAKIKAAAFNMILMDVQMPDMDGLTATRAIRKWESENNLKPTPIIGITDYILSDDKEKCLAAGIDDYVPKPFTPELLASKIENILNNAPDFYRSVNKFQPADT